MNRKKILTENVIKNVVIKSVFKVIFSPDK